MTGQGVLLKRVVEVGWGHRAVGRKWKMISGKQELTQTILFLSVREPNANTNLYCFCKLGISPLFTL